MVTSGIGTVRMPAAGAHVPPWTPVSVAVRVGARNGLDLFEVERLDEAIARLGEGEEHALHERLV